MSKVWFITGCSKGFGKCLVEQLLHSTNDSVIATARSPEGLKELQAQHADRVLVLPLDVTNSNQIQEAVKSAIDKFKRIDVLVNNAGYGVVGALEEASMQEIKAIFDTNVFGLMEVTQQVLPYMRKQKSGHIINISSIAGLASMPGVGIYNSTKFAVEGFSGSLALDVAHFGIKVTLIEPGPFRTDFASTTSLKVMPLREEYKESASYLTRGYFVQTHGNQEGDPIKAAEVIIKVSKMENPPLRLPLGNPAMDHIIAKCKDWEKEFREHEALARSVDYSN